MAIIIEHSLKSIWRPKYFSVNMDFSEKCIHLIYCFHYFHRCNQQIHLVWHSLDLFCYMLEERAQATCLSSNLSYFFSDVPFQFLIKFLKYQFLNMYAAGVLSKFSILKEIAFLKDQWTKVHKICLHSIAAIDVLSVFFFFYNFLIAKPV